MTDAAGVEAPKSTAAMAQFHSPGLVTCERYLSTVEVAAAPLQPNRSYLETLDAISVGRAR